MTLTHPLVQDGWFHEKSATMWPGQHFSLQVEEILYAGKSQYQDVLVFRSSTYGNVLVLDGAIQATERDEFSYQEMITNLAMMSHPNPRKVLVIGGGDGGVLREVLKHDCVESATLCDIDADVPKVSRLYLKDMASGLDHPKATVHIGDGFKFLDDYKDTFDVIVTDSSDPEGPAESLFQKPYFQLLHDALREGGVITTQAECQWLHKKVITDLYATCRSIFPNVRYAFTTIPSYPSGQIGFMVCSRDKDAKLDTPLRQWSTQEEVEKCRYYNKEVHSAAFVLPTFMRQALSQ